MKLEAAAEVIVASATTAMVVMLEEDREVCNNLADSLFCHFQRLSFSSYALYEEDKPMIDHMNSIVYPDKVVVQGWWALHFCPGWKQWCPRPMWSCRRRWSSRCRRSRYSRQSHPVWGGGGGVTAGSAVACGGAVGGGGGGGYS